MNYNEEYNLKCNGIFKENLCFRQIYQCLIIKQKIWWYIVWQFYGEMQVKIESVCQMKKRVKCIQNITRLKVSIPSQKYTHEKLMFFKILRWYSVPYGCRFFNSWKPLNLILFYGRKLRRKNLNKLMFSNYTFKINFHLGKWETIRRKEQLRS